MIAPALIAKACETQTYAQVARRFGLTRNAVAGLVWRDKNRRLPRPAPLPRKSRAGQRVDTPTLIAVIDMLADGRPRTTSEIAERLDVPLQRARWTLHRLVSTGAAVRLTPGAGGTPAIWQEAPE